ncbi:xylulokinase [Pseudooceanicola sp. 200-1SW]|uniref:xylulokinase n=1 Tax=Pseudooceanicola sp. 200-1SW TaxID=3425949 RepID=UPI003D7FA795
MSWLGIFIDRAEITGLLTDDSGRCLARDSLPLTCVPGAQGQDEQDPADWWAATVALIDALQEADAGALTAVRGIGLAGHGEGPVLLDGQGRVLCPVPLGGAAMAAGEGALAASLARLRARDPARLAQLALILTPKDYLRHRLADDLARVAGAARAEGAPGAVTDPASASEWHLLDPAGRNWCPQALARAELTAAQLPALRDATRPVARLSDLLRRRWGMRQAVTLGTGCGETAALATGLGLVAPGQGVLSLSGTGWVLVADGAEPAQPLPGLRCLRHALPRRWLHMGAVPMAGDSLAWLGRAAGSYPTDLTRLAQQGFRGPGAELFLPPPAPQPFASPLPGPGAAAAPALAPAAAFVGLAGHSDLPRLAQAVLEGVACALRELCDRLRANGVRLERMQVIGAGAQSRLWVEILATQLRLDLCLPAAGVFGAALGAARLAQLSVSGVAPPVICTAPPVLDRVMPMSDHGAAYEAQYRRFRAVTDQLRGTLPGDGAAPGGGA